MKLKHLIVSSFAICGLLTACLSEPDFEPVEEGSGIEISLDGSIKQVATKVNAEGFETGDALGLYAVNYENNNQTPGTLQAEGNQADHVKYIFNFEKWQWTPVKPVYYKDINTNVDLYVFYPHAEPQSVEAYNFEVQKDQSRPETPTSLGGYEASDFLWAKVENVAPTESKIKVQLNHKMAGVQVILAEGTGFEQDEFPLLEKSVLAVNTTRKATINMANGEVAPLGEPQATGIVMCPQTDGSFRGIVVPQSVAAGTHLFKITIDGMTYSFKKDVDFTYEAGKVNKFTININRKAHTGEYELEHVETDIVAWTEDLNEHNGEARQYYCVNVSEPGTLGRLIKADKKNPDKIKNLKVTGDIFGGDFYFMRDSMALLQSVNLHDATIHDTYRYKVYKGATYKDYHFTEPQTLEQLQQVAPHADFLPNPKIMPANEIPESAFSGKTSLVNFVFPTNITKIGNTAFYNCSNLSGALIIPNEVTLIGENAFYKCSGLTSLSFPHGIQIIEGYAFSECVSLSGQLCLPNSIYSIGPEAFKNCKGFTGHLILPDSLTELGEEGTYIRGVFAGCSGFSGSLVIPESLTIIPSATFQGCSGMNGNLILHDNLTIYKQAFRNCSFQGELKLPSNITTIPEACFEMCRFTSISFPEELISIEASAFASNTRLTGILEFPQSLVSIKNSAFSGCSNLEGAIIPADLNLIGAGAFNSCYYMHTMVLNSAIPPVIQSSVFSGVPKDNFTLEVPTEAVTRYATDPVWGQFRRISAHYDFSISRKQARALNDETSKTYILRAPANHAWSIESKPDWITVTPSSGTGKTEVTVTFSEMVSADASSISVEMTHPTYAYQTTTKNLKGRAGEIVFLLDDKDYRTTMTVEQFDYQYSDGDVITLNEATKGNGVDIVFMGDCYDAADIAAGNYIADIQEAMGHYFDIEPYKTYKDYFNVYAVVGVSDDSGMGTLNTVKDAKFGSTFGETNLVQPDMETCFEYACKAPIDNNLAQTLIVLVENTTDYGGICYMYGDGTAVACCPKSADAYPYDFRGIVQHEAGGHGFGKLADEYIYHNAFISTCNCMCCGHQTELLKGKSNGWYRNIELTGDMNEVGWSHFIFHPKYSNVVDIYEGGYFHTRGVYRSEPTSCMNNNIPYYSAISRQAMVERIMEYAGETFDLEDFISKDVTTAGPTTKVGPALMPIETFYDNGKQHAPVYMGEKPDFKR